MSLADALSTSPDRYTPSVVEQRRQHATPNERELARRLRWYSDTVRADAELLLGPGHPDRLAFLSRLGKLIGEPGLLDLSHALDGGPRASAAAAPAEAGHRT